MIHKYHKQSPFSYLKCDRIIQLLAFKIEQSQKKKKEKKKQINKYCKYINNDDDKNKEKLHMKKLVW